MTSLRILCLSLVVSSTLLSQGCTPQKSLLGASCTSANDCSSGLSCDSGRCTPVDALAITGVVGTIGPNLFVGDSLVIQGTGMNATGLALEVFDSAGKLLVDFLTIKQASASSVTTSFGTTAAGLVTSATVPTTLTLKLTTASGASATRDVSLLRGEPGAAGAAGAAGATGAAGTNGPTGPTGAPETALGDHGSFAATAIASNNSSAPNTLLSDSFTVPFAGFVRATVSGHCIVTKTSGTTSDIILINIDIDDVGFTQVRIAPPNSATAAAIPFTVTSPISLQFAAGSNHTVSVKAFRGGGGGSTIDAGSTCAGNVYSVLATATY